MVHRCIGHEIIALFHMINALFNSNNPTQLENSIIFMLDTFHLYAL